MSNYNITDDSTEPIEVSPRIIGGLILGELPYWDIGVARITYDEEYHEVNVRGSRGNIRHSISCDLNPYRTDDEVDCDKVAEAANEAIQQEVDHLEESKSWFHQRGPEEAAEQLQETEQYVEEAHR